MSVDNIIEKHILSSSPLLTLWVRKGQKNNAIIEFSQKLFSYLKNINFLKSQITSFKHAVCKKCICEL